MCCLCCTLRHNLSGGRISRGKALGKSHSLCQFGLGMLHRVSMENLTLSVLGLVLLVLWALQFCPCQCNRLQCGGVRTAAGVLDICEGESWFNCLKLLRQFSHLYFQIPASHWHLWDPPLYYLTSLCWELLLGHCFGVRGMLVCTGCPCRHATLKLDQQEQRVRARCPGSSCNCEGSRR